MATRYLLYFTSEDHYLYKSSGTALALEAKFAAGEAGVDALRVFLRSRPRALFSIVADLAGEDFHEDQIPFLRGADRDAVVQRRLAQRYRDTRLAAALSLGQVTTPERRNERLLLASFTNTNQLTPWLDALEDSDARLAGLYSVPLLAPALAARLGVRDGRSFVVTTHRAGLRQCFVEDGKLRFARLERAVDLAPQALATFARSETLRLAQYLTTLRALPREGAPVRVVVVAPQGQRSAFEQALASDARLLFTTIDAEEAARRVGLRQLPAGGAEGVYLHLAATRPPREQFASRDDRRRYFIWQLQRGIVAAGALGLAACTLYTGSKWLDAHELRSRAAAQAREAREAAEQYARITAAFPVTQTSTDNLKVAVVEFQRIAARSPLPEGTFVHVSRVLEKFPQFEIDRINWSAGPLEGEAKPARPAEPGKPAAQGEVGVRLEISGRVNATQRDDYRGITAQVQRFAGALAVSGYELARTQLPFDITSEGTLTGDIGGSDSEAPRFTVVLVRRLP